MSVLAVEPAYDVRLVPAPAYEPPYDDEVADADAAAAGSPPLPFAPRRLQLVPPLPGVATSPGDVDEDDLFGPQRTLASALPAVRPWAQRFIQAMLESVEGRRGFGQISPFLSPTLVADMERKAGVRARMAAARTAAQPTVVRSVHVCELDDGIAEVSAVIRRGARTLAVALRLEGIDGRWMCTALQM
jgi:hypothetical protein